MPAGPASRPLRLHIGHHFFGSGNIGDDLMLAGFLVGIGEFGREPRLTCASAFDIKSQKRRFPQIDWLPYDMETRRAAVQKCDAWVGVGDTPFQIVVGPWFLEHLVAELELCRAFHKPMFFVGIGINEPAALDDPRARQVIDYASHIWARDSRSAEMLRNSGAAGKVSESADLAHIWLRERQWPKPEVSTIGYVLNFEDPTQFDAQALAALLNRRDGIKHRWLAQEVRCLKGSELDTLDRLPEGIRSRLDVRVPDYAHGSLEELVYSWGVPETLITSRYHAGLIAAWMQARVLVIERSEKVVGLAQQIGLSRIATFCNADEVSRKLDEAKPVARQRLDALADLAARSCRELLEIVVPHRSSSPTRSIAELASIESMNSERSASFMKMMNSFAGAHGLRQFTNWTKIWEYPWLWHHALAEINWAGKYVVDLGSELSPMPWLLATLGAKVVLIEADQQWVARWQELRDKLKLDVSWHVVQNETIPLPDRWADVVTSFSVIEHQRDKAAAVAEVARVLKPGGLFAVSFDICEESMGMKFPEWNGRALSLREFEDVLWLHPAFGNRGGPRWNMDAIGPFLAWHRTTAPHHNYVAGAAVLYKLGSV